ncbi:hypothetical protein QPL79_02730 [Ignisphaera sp. 4213-co]|uniref:Uncharacterized protein n=1 Tax=Ignisphaera cupida TaxID=3050454 RepID=A0ABD4Z6A7_9CREN|nr:hypothetical protein [Ignisphaera sp. 4213-co]MDK6028279.1 hypothetical protein [Ignisphaera sp. 4213-co]
MPVIYRCLNCGEILYKFIRAGQDYYGIPSLSELKVKIGNQCPKCGKKLRESIDLHDIFISIRK